MLNHVHIPEGTLNAPEAQWAEANEAQRTTILEQAKIMAEYDTCEKQHRNFVVDPTGRVTSRTIYVCTGENYRNRSDIVPDSTFTFVWPGEPQSSPSGLHNWKVDYEYSDDPKSPGRRWLAFLLDTERCPWRYVLRHAMSLDPEECYRNRNVTFQHLDQLPWDPHQLWMMAGRWMLENPTGLHLWCRLVDEGIHPAIAWVLGVTYGTEPHKDIYNSRSPLDHEPLYDLKATAEGIIKGTYYPQPRRVVQDCARNGAFLVKGVRPPSGPMSMGFSPLGRYAHDKHKPYFETADPTPIGQAFYDFYKVNQRVTYAQLLDLAVLLDGKIAEVKSAPPVVVPKDIVFSIDDEYDGMEAGEYSEGRFDEPEQDDDYNW